MADITPNIVVSMPSQLFTLRRAFKSCSNGKIYIGKIDTDPTLPENQIQAYLENEDGSYSPVAQPLIIGTGGYPVYNGQIAKFVTVEGHAMAVYDGYGVQQFYFPNVLKYEPKKAIQELHDKLNKIPSSINTLVSRGLVPALSGNNQGTSGIQMYEAYNNGYPTPYGNVIHLKGASAGGEGELLVGWSDVHGAHAPLYIRSRRDIGSAHWSAWAQVFTANEIQAYTETELDRRYQPKGAGQSYTKVESDARYAGSGQTRTQVFHGRDGWWYKDGSSGFIFQGGVFYHRSPNRVNFPLVYQKECFGVQMTLWGRPDSFEIIYVVDVDDSGFTAERRAIRAESCWWAVGV